MKPAAQDTKGLQHLQKPLPLFLSCFHFYKWIHCEFNLIFFFFQWEDFVLERSASCTHVRVRTSPSSVLRFARFMQFLMTLSLVLSVFGRSFSVASASPRLASPPLVFPSQWIPVISGQNPRRVSCTALTSALFGIGLFYQINEKHLMLFLGWLKKKKCSNLCQSSCKISDRIFSRSALRELSSSSWTWEPTYVILSPLNILKPSQTCLPLKM